MRIKRQRETFAYRLADMSTPFIIGDNPGGRGSGGSGGRGRNEKASPVVPDANTPRGNLSGPWTSNPDKWNQMAEAEQNRSGPKMPKRVITPGAPSGGSGGSNTSGGGGASSGYRGNGKSGRDGLNPAAMAFYDELAAEHPDLAMGGYNPTVDQSWDEHQTGNAIDVMISDLERGNAIRDRALARPDIRHVIWQQQLFRPDGSSYTMEDRRSPTENHFDHVHIMLNG